jgi:hypothetical protein
MGSSIHCFTDFETHLTINTSGVLTSPYYPSVYLNNITRRWHLKTTNGQRVRLKFLYLNIERDPECKNDYVMIQDGEKQFYFCGRTIPDDFKSRSNQLLITFKSDENIVRTGFKIQYTIVEGKGIIVLQPRMCLFGEL